MLGVPAEGVGNGRGTAADKLSTGVRLLCVGSAREGYRCVCVCVVPPIVHVVHRVCVCVCVQGVC